MGSEVSKEVRKIKGGLNLKNAKVFKKPGPKEEGNGTVEPKKKGLVIMTGVAKKKPEVMEQNQDALEYSSEEEVDIDDLKDKLEMQKRRERIEKWRSEKKKKGNGVCDQRQGTS